MVTAKTLVNLANNNSSLSMQSLLGLRRNVSFSLEEDYFSSQALYHYLAIV